MSHSSAGLRSLLDSIGAHSLSSELVVPSYTGTPQFAQLQLKLNQQLDKVNVSLSSHLLQAVFAPCARLMQLGRVDVTGLQHETRELLESHWSQFQEQVADGKELLARLDEEKDELHGLEQELRGEVSDHN